MIEKKIQKIVALCTLVVLLCIVLFSYKLYDEYKTVEYHYTTVQESMKNQVNIILKTALTENVKKAEEYMNDNTNIIHARLLSEYGDDLDGLENDIALPTEDSKIAKILNDVLTDFYINEDTSSNKPFVISMSNVIWNKSFINGKVDNSVMTIDELINIQYNKKLASDAINAIKDKNIQKNDFIFWEFIPNTDIEHEIISDMYINEIYNIYHTEGLDGLKSYELLIPTYITKDGDIFGNSDINSLGQKMDNYKLIVIQRISVYDILKKYSSDLAYCEGEVYSVKEEALDTNRHRAFAMSQSLIIIVFILIGSAYIQNNIISKNK